MSWLSNVVSNYVQAEQLVQLAEMNEKMGDGGQYDWQSKIFQDAMEQIKVDFYARHPEIERKPGNLAKRFPEKEEAVKILNKLSEYNRINPDEYILLFKQIFDF